MLTKELIARIAEEMGTTKKHTEEILSATTRVMLEAVVSGKSVQIQGLGALETKERAARTIVHPGTGERTTVPAKSQITFRPASNIKDELKNI